MSDTSSLIRVTANPPRAMNASLIASSQLAYGFARPVRRRGVLCGTYGNTTDHLARRPAHAREWQTLLEEPGHGWVYAAPLSVEFPETEEGVQPDLIFVSRQRAERLVHEGIRGAPDLVVEVLSPSTAERDRTIKRKLYLRQGVRAYWIVDHDAEYVDVWDFEFGGDDPIRRTHRLPVELGGGSFGVISLPDIFAPER